MAMKQNPLHGDVDISPTGIKRIWNNNLRVWEKELSGISPDTTNTTSLTKKIWSGTLPEYNTLGTYHDDVIYFVKE